MSSHYIEKKVEQFLKLLAVLVPWNHNTEKAHCRPPTKWPEGNVFTGVCLSIGKEGRVSLVPGLFGEGSVSLVPCSFWG